MKTRISLSITLLFALCLACSQQRETKVYPITSPPPSPTTAVPPAKNESTPVEVDLKIRGNKNSMIYHLPNCASYGKISEKNVVWFKTTEEAEAAGYRMARNCS